MKKIFLITKLDSSNLGNQALSTEIIRLFTDPHSEDMVYTAGRPMGLEGYYVKRIVHNEKPEDKLDRWAERVIKKMKAEPKQVFKGNNPRLNMVMKASPQVRWEPLKAKLRPIKRVLNTFRIYSDAYKQRAAVLQNADWLIYSGAGEVGDYSVFLRQLLEIRVAQKLGIRTAAVNQSVVIHTPLFQRLTGHVYGKMNVVVVRGETTASNLKSYGVPEGIIRIAPDSAINAIYNEARPASAGKVGLNLTPKCRATEQNIERIVNHLRAKGKEPVFITNEPFGDHDLQETICNKFGLQALTDIPDYNTYMGHLAGFDFVVSARLHTNILSLATQTPIVPIEGNVFKTTELLNQLQYPIETVNPAETNWVDDLLDKVDQLMSDRYPISHYFNQVLPERKGRVHINASWLNDY